MKLFPIVQIVQGSRWGGGWHSLRKQPTFGDVTTGFPAKWRLRNERRNSTQIWVGASVLPLYSFFCFICNVLRPPPFICFYTPLSFSVLALSCLLTLSDRVLRIYWFLPFGLHGAIICHWSMVSSLFVVYLELPLCNLSLRPLHYAEASPSPHLSTETSFLGCK